MTEHIKVSNSDGVLEITFARPDKKNALTNAMYRAAGDALLAAQDDRSVRIVLISAEGDAFTAGNDLADFANAKEAKPQAGHLVGAIIGAKKPIVAAVQGLAVGVGTTMLLHCDLVYVADVAKLLAPFNNLGLVPEAGSSMLLPARIGHPRAFAMFALGEPVTGAEAVAMGLANKVLPQDEVRATAQKAARALAAKPLRAVMETKRLMRDTATLAEHMKVERVAFEASVASEEAQEAFRAFAERRPPDFSRFGT